MKVAGIVGGMLAYLKRFGLHRSKSVTTGGLNCHPNSSSTRLLLRVLEVGSSKPAVEKRQLTHSDLDSNLE